MKNLTAKKNNLTKMKVYLERIKMQYTLICLREILLNEKNKGYYRNAINIKETIELESEIESDNLGKEYVYNQNMQIYENDFCEIYTLKRSYSSIKHN